MEQIASRQIQIATEFVGSKIQFDKFRYENDINYGWVITCNDKPFMYLTAWLEPDSVDAIVNGLNIAASKYWAAYDAGYIDGKEDAETVTAEGTD